MAPQSACVWSPAAVSKSASSRLAVSVPFAPSHNSSAWCTNPRTPTPYLTQRTTRFSRSSDGIPSMYSLYASNFDPRVALDWGFGTPYERVYLRTVFFYDPTNGSPSPFNSYRSFTFPLPNIWPAPPVGCSDRRCALLAVSLSEIDSRVNGCEL